MLSVNMLKTDGDILRQYYLSQNKSLGGYYGNESRSYKHYS